MKRLLFFLLPALLITFVSHAQIATYTGSGGTSTATVGVANETVTSLMTAGFGANTPCGSGGLSGITVNTIWTTYSISGPRVYFKITPNTGYQINVTNVTVGIRRSGTGPVNTRLAYSLDNGTTWSDDGTDHAASTGGCNSSTTSSWGSAGATLPTGVTSTTNGVIIALFPYAPGASAGTYQVNTIVVNGSVTVACTAPTAFAVTGGGSFCSGSAGVAVGLANSQTGVNYQLYNGSTAVGSPVAGTGSPISFGTLTTAGTYTVSGSSGASCSTGMTGSATIVVNPVPAAIGGTPTVCAGSTTSLTETATGGTWSSSNTGAGTVSTVGVVTGLSAGTTIISYTFATGCNVTKTVTVNAQPTAITGTTAICAGVTSTLGNTVGGGTWTSSNTSVASIGSSTGALLGIAGGTTNITYTATGGCYAATVATVNNPPDLISGPSAMCATTSATFTNTVSGGTWSSSTVATATAAPGTGLVNAVAAGTTVISYTIPTCAAATVTLSVSPQAPITGITNVCTGTTATLSNTVPMGAWASSNSSVASIGTSSGIVTGVATGTAVVSYILATGCYSTTIVTVSTIGPVTGSLTLCVGLTSALSNIATGGTWSIAPTAVAAVNTTSGVVTGVAAGVATVTYTLSSGCTVTNTLIVYGLPNAITGPTQVCQGQTITVGDSSPGGIWSSSTPSIAAISSGGVISGGGVAGTAVISYTLPTTCYSTRVVTVNPLPADISGSNYVCLGSATVLTDASTPGTWSSSSPSIAPVGPTTGNVIGNTAGLATITYTLPTGCYKLFLMHVSTPPSAAPAGGAALCEASSTVLTNAVPGGTWSSASPFIASVGTAGIVTGVVTGLTTISYTIPGCTPALYTVSVNPIPAPITGVSSVCVAHTTTLADASGGGVWSVSGASASISPIGVVTGLAYGATSVVSYTFPATGCRRTVNIMVDSLPSPIVGTDSVCKGSSVTLTDPSPFGIWSSSDGTIASAIAATGEVIGVLSGNVHISYTLISGCYVETPFKVIEPLVASVTLTDTPVANPLCEGTPITLTAHAVNGGVAPIFIWQRFGADIHTDTGINTYTFLPEHGDFMRVYMVAQGICAAPVPATDSLVMTVYPHAAPIVSIHTDFNPLASTPPNSCASVTGIFETASITGDTITLHWNAATGTTGYEWVAGKSPNIMPSSGNYTNTTSVIVTTTGYPDGMQRYYLVRNKCSTGNSDWASDPLLIPYWGQMVTFTSDVTYGGTGAQYQWLKNGAPIPGATNHTYAQPMYYNDTFSLQVTSDAPCNTATIGASNRIIVMASQLAVPAAGALHELSLYPNPNKGIFTVSGNVNADVKEVTLEVNDILGREVYRGATQVHNGSLHGQVQLSNNLPAGSYLLRVHAGTGVQVFNFVLEQ